jgi:hypothetical protein
MKNKKHQTDLDPQNPNINTSPHHHSLLKSPFYQHVSTVPGWCLDVCDLAATILEPAAAAQPSKMTAEIVLQTKRTKLVK